MVRIRPTVTVDLKKSGQTITLDLNEARELIASLSKFVNNDDDNNRNGRAARKTTSNATKSRKSRRKNKTGSPTAKKIPSMSEAKRQEITKHVYQQLSNKPKTLSGLLKGVSYVPNYLPAIRKMVESQADISKEIIGKRTYYYQKGSTLQSSKQSRTSAAAA